MVYREEVCTRSGVVGTRLPCPVYTLLLLATLVYCPAHRPCHACRQCGAVTGEVALSKVVLPKPG